MSTRPADFEVVAAVVSLFIFACNEWIRLAGETCSFWSANIPRLL